MIKEEVNKLMKTPELSYKRFELKSADTTPTKKSSFKSVNTVVYFSFICIVC